MLWRLLRWHLRRISFCRFPGGGWERRSKDSHRYTKSLPFWGHGEKWHFPTALNSDPAPWLHAAGKLSQLWRFWAEAWRLSLPWHWQRPKSLGRAVVMSRASRKPHWAGEQKSHLSSAKPLRNRDHPWPHPGLVLPAALWVIWPPCTVLPRSS